jgi:uncharacterized protein
VNRPEAETAFREFVAGERFTCLGARAALRRGTLRVVVLDEMGSAAATSALHEALLRLVREELGEERGSRHDFVTLAALFRAPLDLDEQAFDRRVWAQLQSLHDLDARSHPWASGVDRDPASARFGYSVGAHPFFVVGLHPHASRIARRFRLPALTFNSHHQFDRLKEQGRYGVLKQRIRERELRLQGTLNPNLADFGERSEARQYSGLAVGEDWQCPFRPREGPAR